MTVSRAATAWYLAHPPVNTADGPGEWNVDLAWGDDPPDGNGWEPLYAAPARLEPVVAWDMVTVPRDPTDAMLEAALDEAGWRAVAHIAPRESGVALDSDTTEADAAEINAAGKDAMAATYRVMIETAPSPPSHQGLREAQIAAVAKVIEGRVSGFAWMSFGFYEMVAMECLEAARAALQSQPAPSGREVGWLIERKNFDGETVPYWYVENAMGFHWWTPVAFDAKRFATKAEAEAYPAYQMIASDPTISITEHVFLSRAQPAPSGETK